MGTERDTAEGVFPEGEQFGGAILAGGTQEEAFEIHGADFSGAGVTVHAVLVASEFVEVAGASVEEQFEGTISRNVVDEGGEQLFAG